MRKIYTPNIRIASRCIKNTIPTSELIQTMRKKDRKTNPRSWRESNSIIRITSIFWREIHPQNVYIWTQLAQGHSRDQPQHQNCFKIWETQRKKENQHSLIMMWERKTASLVEWQNKAHLCNENHKIITWSSPAASHEPWLSRWTWHLPPHEVGEQQHVAPAGGSWPSLCWRQPCPGVPTPISLVSEHWQPRLPQNTAHYGSGF